MPSCPEHAEERRCRSRHQSTIGLCALAATANAMAARLKDGGATLQRRLAAAFQGMTDAWSLSVTKIPAVVVDQRYVVYGEPDYSSVASQSSSDSTLMSSKR
jgi:integrating conjugative element protein (TIGR03757 family)